MHTQSVSARAELFKLLLQDYVKDMKPEEVGRIVEDGCGVTLTRDQQQKIAQMRAELTGDPSASKDKAKPATARVADHKSMAMSVVNWISFVCLAFLCVVCVCVCVLFGIEIVTCLLTAKGCVEVSWRIAKKLLLCLNSCMCAHVYTKKAMCQQQARHSPGVGSS